MKDETSDSISRLWGHVDATQRESLTRLFPLVYSHLHDIARKQMAQQPADHTLQPTALVHEAFLRIQGAGTTGISRDHVLALAATAMRSILVDYARARVAQKRGSGARQLSLSGFDEVGGGGGGGGGNARDISIVELDDALGRLATLDERRARVVEMRFFGGMTNEETAVALGVSRSTVAEDWAVARAWLRTQLKDSNA